MESYRIGGGECKELLIVTSCVDAEAQHFIAHVMCVMARHYAFFLLRCIAPHILLKISTLSLPFYFSPIFLVWHAGDVPRRGECREALPYMTMLVVVCT